MGGGNFSSFKDLLGDSEPDDEDPSGDAEDEVLVEESDDASGDETYGETLRRLRRGGDGFGPMTHGPARYADVESEEMELFQSFRVRTVFPEAVLTEVGALPDNPPPADYEGVEGREDLRDQRIFTIDGADAKDFDDAICIKKIDDGFEVSVHIADVSHYVKPRTALNAEALARATSVYVADQVVPMLPEKLSNGLCSLRPDCERLAFSVFMEFDEKGARKSYRVAKSVIRSMRRCTYKQVQDLLDGEDNEGTQAIADLHDDLEHFRVWTRKQQTIRDRKGSLRLQSGERKFKFDDDGEVTGTYLSANYFSQTLIEETALAANQAVGDFFKKNGLPTVYRVHPEKDPEEVAEVVDMLGKFGIRVPKKDRLTGRDIGQMVRYARTLPNNEAMIGRIMGLVEKAVYEVRSHDDEAGHFGLAREHYLHFTSPIRRYPDLIVHRMLYEVLTDEKAHVEELSQPDALLDLMDVSGHATHQASLAAMVEVAIDDLKICQLMEPRTGEILKARISRVSRAGLEVQLNDEYVTGFLPSSTLGGQARAEGPVLKVRAGRGTLVFREGDAIEVKVEDVDFVRLRVIFALR